MEMSILILSCAILGRIQKCLFFILLTTICNLNGFCQIKYIHKIHTTVVLEYVRRFVASERVAEPSKVGEHLVVLEGHPVPQKGGVRLL